MNRRLCNNKIYVLLTTVVIVLIMLIASCCTVVFAEKQATDTLNIMHITDIHYYPTYMSYKQSEYNYETSAFVKKSKSESKLLVESSSIIKALFDKIVEEENMPDYLFVTGDLSSDGERDALIDIANALRDLQNRVRAKGNENFQIFVIPGNHDIENINARDYSLHDGNPTSSVTRYEFAKIFASLGYPNMSDDEAKQFYTVEEYDKRSKSKYLPYNVTGNTGTYVPSTLAKNITISYQEDLTSEQATNLSYIVERQDNKTLLALDSVIIGSVGGELSQKTFDWIDEILKGKSNKSIVAMTHHNVLPHFVFEDSWTPDYMLANWEEVRDYFMSKGVKYCFTGHMHANDIASYVDYDGYNLYDIQTGSPIGYGASYRYVQLKHYSDGASDMISTIKSVESVDINLLIKNDYLTEEYSPDYDKWIENGGYIGKVGVEGETLSDYIYNTLYTSLIENALEIFVEDLDKEYVVGKIMEYIDNHLKDGAISNIIRENKETLKTIFLNLYDEIQQVNLKNYEYKGDNPILKEEDSKLQAYSYDFLKSLLDIKVVKGLSQSYTLQDLLVKAYTTYLIGGEGPNLSMQEEWFEKGVSFIFDGDIFDEILDIANDKNKGVITLIQNILDTEYDLSSNLSVEEINTINAILAQYDCSLQKLNIDLLVKNIFGVFGDKLPSDQIDETISKYVTESIAKGVGSNIGEVMVSLVTDTSYDGVHGTQSKILYEQNDEHSHYPNGKKRAISLKDGRMPSMITMSFGKDLMTDKNFVWFTDKRVAGADIQYAECSASDFFKDSTKRISVSGKTDIYAVNYPLIDIGIVSTYQTREVARHTVALNSLKSDTIYSYRVGDADKGYWSEVFTFVTPSNKETAPFETLLVSDMQGMSKNVYDDSAKLLRSANSVFGPRGYDFIINLGDFVDNGNNGNQWTYALNSARDVYTSITQVMVAGNHESVVFEPAKDYIPSSDSIVANGYNPIQLHYNTSFGNKNYYSFNYSGVHFVILDTNDILNDNLGYDQIEWLKNDLQKYIDQPVVVAMHKGIYTVGPHKFDAEIVNMRKTLTKIFSKYGVEIVLQGHDHIYSESYFLDENGEKIGKTYKQGSPINNNNGGVLYITIGSAGDKFYKSVNNDISQFGYVKKLDKPTFGKLQFDGKNLSYCGYEYDLEKDKIEQLIPFSQEVVSLILSIVGIVVLVVILSVVIVVIYKKNRKKTEAYKKEKF